MLFNSLAFAVFLPVVFGLYWATQDRLRLQNFLLLVASYVFYGWWDWRFLSLLFVSSLVDYLVGRGLEHAERPASRKALLGLSLATNLGLLGFFKYFNFFVDSLVEAARFTFDLQLDPARLSLVLPVGISFYTFQTLSYSIDVYRRKIEPTRDTVAFFAFVSFFPQLVAGPIERAASLLPQFKRRRRFEYSTAVDGLRLMLWGFFKKLVVADNCAYFVDVCFAHHDRLNGFTLALGIFFFAFQIYGDFSGYSDIAIGTARLFGFSLMTNFRTPYFSRDIAEFWRRWHISLTTWFRDYLYIPLGGSRGTLRRTVRNVIIVFLVSGLWHGANWTFVVWGLLNAIYFLPLLLRGTNRDHLHRPPGLSDGLKMAGTFGLTLLAWVFFRAPDLGVAVAYLNTILSPSFFAPSMEQLVFISPLGLTGILRILAMVALLLGVEWINREAAHPFDLERFPTVVRHICYQAVLMLILFMGRFEQAEFIYFQF